MTTQTQPAPNLLVYLFAEQFASPVKGLSALAGGMVAPRTGTKVSLQQLVLNLYIAAMMELVQSNTVSFETIEVKKFIGKESPGFKAGTTPDSPPVFPGNPACRADPGG